MKTRMDWSKFDLAMTDPRYLHGAPVFKDERRMPVEAVLDNLDDGMAPDAVAKAYQVDLRLVAGVKELAEIERFAHPVACGVEYEPYQAALAHVVRTTEAG